jgi:hypothetical protein
MTDTKKPHPLDPLRPGRGRPKGSKNKHPTERRTKTLGEFIASSLAKPAKAPPPKPEKPAPKVYTGIWATFATAEERSEYARYLRSKVTPEGLARSGRKFAVPNGWPYRDYEIAKAKAAREAKKMLERMEADGELTDDELARTATLEALTLLRSPGSKTFKLKCARTLLSYYRAKPATASSVAVRVTAEDILERLERGQW